MIVYTKPKLALFCLFAVSPLLSMKLAPNSYEGGRLQDDVDREVRNSSAFATILGEIRTNAADLMFIKTERYLHAGVAYVPHLNMDEMASTGNIADRSGAEDTARVPGVAFAREFEDDHDHDHDHDDHNHGDAAGEGTQTLIPDRLSDFRGPIGYLHRQVKPWNDPNSPHVHSTGHELLPWYRLMTLSDPNNRRAYLIGTWWLKSKQDPVYYEEALRFINEGVRNNPRAYDLFLMRGYVQREMEDLDGARLSFREAGDLAVAARPKELLVEGGEMSAAAANWTSYNEEDARAAVRLAVLLERDIGSPAEALSLAIRYNEEIGGDGRLQAMIQDLSNPEQEPERAP